LIEPNVADDGGIIAAAGGLGSPAGGFQREAQSPMRSGADYEFTDYESTD
jgi:hypothetical protein